jgi:pheromone a factor receptor
MQDPTYPLYPILTFLSFLLILIPLPWHVEAMNSGTVIYILWSALANLNGFVNAVVWRDDALIRTPIWCDICKRILTGLDYAKAHSLSATKFMVGAAVGIPAASLCIVRRLYGITCAKTVTITRNDVSCGLSLLIHC